MTDVTPFYVDRAKGGRASCKGCKVHCPGGELRIAKLVTSPYGENQIMKSWHHVQCFMNGLLKQRPATKRVDSIDDIGNWENISKEDQEYILKTLNETEKLYAEKNSGKYTAKVLKNESIPKASSVPEKPSESKTELETDDNKFSTFISLCKKIAKVDAYTEKTAKVNHFFRKGTDDSFKGDLALWCKLLLPQVTKRVYNLKSKQLVKLFSKILNTDHDDMLTQLEQGDVADTIQKFFAKSKAVQPAQESTLTIQKVEQFLQELSKLTKEEEQIYHFKKIVKKCTLDDMKMLIRLIKGDLRINAGPKHILEGVHPDAYTAFQTSRDLNMVLDRILSQSSGIKHKDVTQNSVHAKLSLMTPVLPMLAEACKSVEMAMKKCPNGMFSEIKYDGERVQVHKKGNEFKYFSRALKPVMPHKVNHFKDYLPKAFPKGTDLILDAEVLMVDVNSGKPLPFGTLGIHKQSEFKDAQVCLYIFDCLYYNGQVLIDMPIRKRRQFLYDNMVEVTNHIMFSEQQLIEKPADLAKMIAKVLQLGLEGLVLKDLESKYEPGKRHWLKVKKDYLFDGAMADTADLVVLGAWFGTGKKGGMMSVFLMGCLDKRRHKWVTVTKVHTGHDDNTLERLQKELSPLMVKISQDYNKVPSWFDCNKGMVPDFIAADPKKQPVWEITGTELTKANLHTADGISVRFPRVTRIRNDKDWETATNLDDLKHLYKTSKEKTDVSLLNKLAATASEADKSPKKKNENSTSKVNKIDSFFTKKDKTNGRSGTSSLNTSNSSDKSKTPLSDESDAFGTSDDLEEKSSKKDRKRKFKEEDLADGCKNDRTSEDVAEKSTKKEKKRKFKEESLDGSMGHKSSEDVEESSSKNSKKRKIKEELNRTNSSENKTDNDRRKKQHVRTSDDAEEAPTKEDKRRHFRDELNRSNLSENKSDNETKIEESPRQKHKAKRRKHSLSSTPDVKDDLAASTSNDLELEFESGPKDPLPDVFKDKRLGFYPDFISIPEEERIDFERHWIAYGGTVVKSIRSAYVDYVVHNDKVIGFEQMQKLRNKVPEHTRHVHKSWLDKCINECTLCDTKTFAVIVEPSRN